PRGRLLGFAHRSGLAPRRTDAALHQERQRLGLSPKTAAGLAGLALQLDEELLVPNVRRDGHDLRVALAHQLRVHHHVTYPDVRQQPAVSIARLHVGLEPHALAGDQTPVRVGRLAASRFLSLGGVVDFRGVHADVADLLDALTDLYVDRVAIHDPDDSPLEWSGRRGWRREEQEGQQAQRARQHAVTVSPTLPRCQQMETLRSTR